jgi:spoIIIJ-associated protein
MFEAWGEDVEVCSEIKDDVLCVELKGENMGLIIGKRGETLDAIQHLTSLSVNAGSDNFIKVNVDTENYREKRNQTLAELSKKLAVRVAKTRKNMTLEPMNSYERRIIHATLQDDKYVTTYSVGQSPNRKVVIAYNKK